MIRTTGIVLSFCLVALTAQASQLQKNYIGEPVSDIRAAFNEEDAWGLCTSIDLHDCKYLMDESPESEEAIKSFSQVVQDALPLVKKRVLSLCDSWAIDPGLSENHVLFNSEQLHIVGNTKGSHGYFYLAAWKK